jgi:hypothetical protein
MNRSNEIIACIDDALNLLSKPLTAQDIESGWTEGVRQNWYRGLTSLKDEIMNDPQGDFTRNNTARALGMDGIDRGLLADRIGHIGTLLMKSGLNDSE